MNQKKYLIEKTLRTITISDEAYNALKDLAHQNNVSLSQVIIDGCSVLQNNDKESIKPLINTLNTATLKPGNITPKPTGSQSSMMTPVTLNNTNVISLFGDELIEVRPGF